MIFVGLYVHIPFCVQKCAYCDFASVAGRGDLFAPYAIALRRELVQRPGLLTGERDSLYRAETIYIGGGTPSVLPLSELVGIIGAIYDEFTPPAGAECTVEVNPATMAPAGMRALREAGVNRLSVGVQSFRDEELALLGRIHDSRTARRTIEEARRAGFPALNLDLIFGLPGQTLADWEFSLKEALSCGPDHISLYALSVEAGTPMAQKIRAGALPSPDPDLAADMYERAEDLLSAAGFEHYEISNWARPGGESRHNLGVWRNGPYLGFGAAAHSHLARRRWWNVSDPVEYVRRMEEGESPAEGAGEKLDEAGDMGETMMLGLRLVREGVSARRFRERYGRTPAETFGDVIEKLMTQGLLEATGDSIRLTRRGRLLGNQVFACFV